MDLLEVADELYGLAPEEFTGTRNERAKQAKADGDGELSTSIKELRKPSLAAWVVNLLMRRQADEMEQVLSLGESLRKAQDSMDANTLRQLTRQRRQLTTVVTNQGRALARELGQRISDAVAGQVEQTLQAAMVDEGAAAAVRAGLLTEALSATGVGEVDVSSAVAVPSAIGVLERRGTASQARKLAKKQHAGNQRRLSVVEDNTRAIEEAKQKVNKAKNAAAMAEKKMQKAKQDVAKLEAKSLQLQGELEELRRRASDLEHRLESVDDDLVAAEEHRDAAQEAHKQARTTYDEARDALARLQRR